jgi:hypothetical protein
MNVYDWMTLFPEEPVRHSASRNVMVATLRALRSMVIILAVVFIVLAVRDGEFQWSRIPEVFALNRALFVTTFVGLWIWEYWLAKAKRVRAVTDRRGV